MAKSPPCCARLEGKVLAKKGEVATVARRAAYAYSKGHPLEAHKEAIAEAKRHLAMAEELVINHEAEHAAE